MPPKPSIISPTKILELPDVQPKRWREEYFNKEFADLSIPILPSSSRSDLTVRLLTRKTHSPIDDVFVSKSRGSAGTVFVTTGCGPFNYQRSLCDRDIDEGDVPCGGMCHYCCCVVDHQLLPMPVSLNVINDFRQSSKKGRKLQFQRGSIVYEVSGPNAYCDVRCMYKVALKKLKIP